MLLVRVRNLTKYFEDRLILSIGELSIHSGDRIGIVGDNGSGKTTLLNLLSGEMPPDSGEIRRLCPIAYIRQFGSGEAEADARLLSEFQLKDKAEQEVLSGGEATRLRIAQAMALDRPLLLADEPTCNLDLEGIRLLKEKLQTVPTFLIVSHDRDLLDTFCTRILEIQSGKITLYSGNYSAYASEKERLENTARQEYREYVEEKRRLEEVYTEKLRRAAKVVKKPKDPGQTATEFFASRPKNTAQKSLQSAAKAALKRVEMLEEKEKPPEPPRLFLDFQLTRPPRNKVLIRCEGLTFGYGEKLLFDHAGFLFENRNKIALVGANGSGKTTLLNLIVFGHPAIQTAPKVCFGYLRQQFEALDLQKSVYENAMARSVQSVTSGRTLLARLLFPAEQLKKPAAVLSGGERIRLSLAQLLLSSANYLVLDEPTNYLDMRSMQAMADVLKEYEGSLLFVSHDRQFVDQVATQTALLQDGKVTSYPGNLSAWEQARDKQAMTVQTERLISDMHRLNELAEQKTGTRAEPDPDAK